VPYLAKPVPILNVQS